jgi:hypothetical protein
VSSFTIRLNFHGDLAFFLRSKAGNKIVERRLREKTSVKDVIESCGVPHPEIDLILVNRQPVGFSHLWTANNKLMSILSNHSLRFSMKIDCKYTI